MKKQLFTCLLFCCTVSIIFSQNKTEQKIAEIERQRFEAMTNKDVAFLKKVLAEEVTYAHSNGLVENKQEHIENVGSGNITYQEMKLEKNNIRTYKKTAINNGIIAVKGLYKGTPFNVRLGFTNVYVKIKRQWKLVSWQSVKLE